MSRSSRGAAPMSSSACRVAVEFTVTAAERVMAARLKRSSSTGWFSPKTSLPCTVDTTGIPVPRVACTAVQPCGISQCAEMTSYAPPPTRPADRRRLRRDQRRQLGHRQRRALEVEERPAGVADVLRRLRQHVTKALHRHPVEHLPHLGARRVRRQHGDLVALADQLLCEGRDEARRVIALPARKGAGDDQDPLRRVFPHCRSLAPKARPCRLNAAAGPADFTACERVWSVRCSPALCCSR